jgi:triacylglycerol lipase
MLLQRRPLPPPSIGRVLFPATYDYPHFLDADKAPFEASADGFSRANAWWGAEASLLAYWRSADIEAALKKVFRNNVAVQNFSLRNVEGYVASFDRFAIVAFRGTEATSLADVLTDVKFAKTKWDQGGRVHDGFFEAFSNAWQAMPSPLPPKARVYFMGHSLGAAIATLVADTFVNGANRAQYGGVYTFGSPLVGDREFVDAFNARHAGKSFRTVNDHDGVALVPPRFVGFRHVNEEHFVGLSVRDAPGLEALIDHTPSRYSILCWNAMVDEHS